MPRGCRRLRSRRWSRTAPRLILGEAVQRFRTLWRTRTRTLDAVHARTTGSPVRSSVDLMRCRTNESADARSTALGQASCRTAPASPYGDTRPVGHGGPADGARPRRAQGPGALSPHVVATLRRRLADPTINTDEVLFP